MTSEIDRLFIENKPSLVIGYGNADLPFNELQHSLSAFTAPSFISSSCLGALLCDSSTIDAGCQLALIYRLKQQAEAHKKESDALL